MSKLPAKEVRAKTKELKAKLEAVRDDLYDILHDFSDLDYNVECHMKIVGNHYSIDSFRLFKESEIDEDDNE